MFQRIWAALTLAWAVEAVKGGARGGGKAEELILMVRAAKIFRFVDRTSVVWDVAFVKKHNGDMGRSVESLGRV